MASRTGIHHQSDQPFSPTDAEMKPVDVMCQKLKKLAIRVSSAAPSTPQLAIVTLDGSNDIFEAPVGGGGYAPGGAYPPGAPGGPYPGGGPVTPDGGP